MSESIDQYLSRFHAAIITTANFKTTISYRVLAHAMGIDARSKIIGEVLERSIEEDIFRNRPIRASLLRKSSSEIPDQKFFDCVKRILSEKANQVETPYGFEEDQYKFLLEQRVWCYRHYNSEKNS